MAYYHFGIILRLENTIGCRDGAVLRLLFNLQRRSNAPSLQRDIQIPAH